MHGNDLSGPFTLPRLAPGQPHVTLGTAAPLGYGKVWRDGKWVEVGRRDGGGSHKGRPNRINRDIKEMVLGVLNELGGTKYLAEQAQKNPAPFLALSGNVLPHTIIGTGADGAIENKLVKFGEPKTIDAVASTVTDAIVENANGLRSPICWVRRTQHALQPYKP